MSSELPENLVLLHQWEEEQRGKAVSVIVSNARLALHLDINEKVMDMLDVFRQLPTEDEDLKVVQMLGLRLFNAFASSIKLVLAGYSQTSVMILRDILETVFLVDLFRADRESITRWRLANKQTRRTEFRPIKVREALDLRDGLNEKKRAQKYKLFSELAGHPSMLSVRMLCPKDGDARNGPFIDPTALEAVLTELGCLAIQVGEIIGSFFSTGCQHGETVRKAFVVGKTEWIAEFYGNSPDKLGSCTVTTPL